jgi:hypothetical protein
MVPAVWIVGPPTRACNNTWLVLLLRSALFYLQTLSCVVRPRAVGRRPRGSGSSTRYTHTCLFCSVLSCSILSTQFRPSIYLSIYAPRHSLISDISFCLLCTQALSSTLYRATLTTTLFTRVTQRYEYSLSLGLFPSLPFQSHPFYVPSHESFPNLLPPLPMPMAILPLSSHPRPRALCRPSVHSLVHSSTQSLARSLARYNNRHISTWCFCQSSIFHLPSTPSHPVPSHPILCCPVLSRSTVRPRIHAPTYASTAIYSPGTIHLI